MDRAPAPAMDDLFAPAEKEGVTYLPATTPSPATPATGSSHTPSPAERVRNDLLTATADALAAQGKQAYMEFLMRNHPKAFVSLLATLLPAASGRQATPAAVVNVVSAIPRTPLDGLPEGFSLG